jgi:hypothetical protein
MNHPHHPMPRIGLHEPNGPRNLLLPQRRRSSAGRPQRSPHFGHGNGQVGRVPSSSSVPLTISVLLPPISPEVLDSPLHHQMFCLDDCITHLGEDGGKVAESNVHTSDCYARESVARPL